ncbi:MAG TPA: DUF305 domain-containing protein [Aquirhabdus sp.]
MFSQIKIIKHNHSILSVFVITAAAAVMVTTSAWTNAKESVHTDNKPMSSMKMDGMTADTMDHSKMSGMTSHSMDHSKMKGMSMTGDTDYDFAANMRMHHQMAVDMSQAELKNGKNPQMLRMAKHIIAAQKKEIAVLDKWLIAHKKPEMKLMKSHEHSSR